METSATTPCLSSDICYTDWPPFNPPPPTPSFPELTTIRNTPLVNIQNKPPIISPLNNLIFTSTTRTTTTNTTTFTTIQPTTTKEVECVEYCKKLGF